MYEQLLGSIKGFMYKQTGLDIYDAELPEQIKVPSIFIPHPQVIPQYHSKDSYRNIYSLTIKVFHESAENSSTVADDIAQAIRDNKFKIPVLEQNGTETSNTIVFDRVETNNLEDHMTILVLEWVYDFNFK